VRAEESSVAKAVCTDCNGLHQIRIHVEDSLATDGAPMNTDFFATYAAQILTDHSPLSMFICVHLWLVLHFNRCVSVPHRWLVTTPRYRICGTNPRRSGRFAAGGVFREIITPHK
jgi:hypothetical protein